MKNQLKFTEDVLFNNYMVSSSVEEFVHSQIPFFIDKNICGNIRAYSEEINRISLKVLSEINGRHKELLKYVDDFPLKKKIFALKCPMSRVYWTRYDTFIDTNDDIYFAEFNYDKPCGQKEIALTGKEEFKGNLNEGFEERLKDYLIDISREFVQDEKINVGFLMDPAHYEEFHHSYYFKDIFKDTCINIIPVGTNNLSVIEGDVYAFSKIKVKVILRMFPAEYLQEVNNIDEILDCFNEGRVLIVNDPRIIAIQSKGYFAYLWDLVKRDSNLLSAVEKKTIESCIPYTEILSKDNLAQCLNRKDKYVVKACLGRYSEEVYLGKLYNDDDWNKQLEAVLSCGKMHVLQHLIDIRQEHCYAPDYNNRNTPLTAYGNFGVYIMDNKSCGILVRWSSSLLTNDDYTWMSPLGEDEYPLKIEKRHFDTEEKRVDFYEDLSEELAFKYDFTGPYTNILEYISLDNMIIKRSLYNEMKDAGHKFCSILKKVCPHIKENLELFGPILGIPERLYKMIEISSTSELCAVGRIDFAVDDLGKLNILEFNSETPAGFVESMGINSIMKSRLYIKQEDPNVNLKNSIKNVLKNIINEIEKHKYIKNIAVVMSWYYEDIFNTNVISEILKECGSYNIIFGNIYDMKVMDNKIYLYGNEIDAIYRYYPLDWFYYDEDMRKFIEPLSTSEYLINPAHTLISQSKALFAVLYELIGKGILDNSEEQFIEKYIPYTTIQKDKKLSHDFLAKPYLSREGNGIEDSFKEIDEDKDYIYQDRVNIRPLRLTEHTCLGAEEKFQFPIIGAYIADDVVCGIYTRMGEAVTDITAKYVSTYIE